MMAIENRNGMNKVMEIFTNPEAVLPSLHVHMHKPVNLKMFFLLWNAKEDILKHGSLFLAIP